MKRFREREREIFKKTERVRERDSERERETQREREKRQIPEGKEIQRVTERGEKQEMECFNAKITCQNALNIYQSFDVSFISKSAGHRVVSIFYNGAPWLFSL